MKVSDKGVAALVMHEGVVPGPYRDSVGVMTYGVGHTAAAGAPDPSTLPRGMPADLDTALQRVFDLFRADLAKYGADVLRAVKVPMAQHEFDALVSFHFNTGAIARAKVTEHLNRGDRAAAAAAFMAWTKPAGITDRRKAEQALFAKGIYPTGKAAVWGVTTGANVIWKPVRLLTPDDILRFMRVPLPDPAPAPRPSFWPAFLAWLSGMKGPTS